METKSHQKTTDQDYTTQHEKYNSDPMGYWEWAGRRFGQEQGGWRAVLDCGGSDAYNRYMDFVHRRALHPFIIQSRGKRVLDLGCGVGRWTIRLAALGAIVIGIDWSLKMLHVGRQSSLDRGLNPLFVQMSLTNLGLPDNSFDLVTCIIVLLHIKQEKDFRAAIREMIRVARPGGRIVILDEIPKTKIPAGQISKHRSLSEYREAVEEAGACVEKVRFAAVSPYRIIFDSLDRSKLPIYVKKPVAALSSIILGIMDIVLIKWTSIPERFWMQDKLVIIRKPPM
jgi:ubiquinone/menaquinone biosynthesis C-methylase UbiE